MQTNQQFDLAFNLLQNTGTNLFLTGKAGTGKTTFLKRLKEVSPKRMIVVAPTGVAAINAGGVTIHSFFQLPFGPYIPSSPEYRGGKTDFYKPVSCHLYPIRVGNYGPYQAVNYHRWDVCKAAVLLGKKENVPVYRFLKEPLIRKFGKEWYDELEIAVKELQDRGMI